LKMRISNFIDGEFTAPIENRMMDDSNPANGAHIAMIPRASASDVDAAVIAAKRALPQWSALTMLERADWLDQIADALEEIKEEIAQTESLDTGKPISLARSVDATRSISNFRFFAKFARSQEPLIFEMSDATNYVHTSPLGIVGLITPWNLPLYLLTWKVAPALLMGNCIIAKPSEITPLTADLLAQTMQRIKLPNGVFNLVHGLGPEVGQAILEHPDIAGISFTGGTATGRIVARTAAPLFKKLSLELGGKNATIILDDANLDTVVPGAVRAAFTNSGQVCLCGSRILIHQSIYDEFCKRFVEQVNAMKVGDPSDESTQMGSVISMQHLQKIESYIDLAVDEGGEILSGGSRAMTGQVGSNPAGAFIRPTVIGGLSHLSRTSTEEIFGPVVTLHSFATDDEAIEMANCTEYGLAGSIWTEDAERGKELAQRIDSGIIWVNTWLHRDLRTPFGGVKNSGVGREGGRWSLSFFSEMTNVCVKH
jgi:aminomuconate-semialdehyde/2-hydroxymuconate-6-semialdehyde dehydrogenase